LKYRDIGQSDLRASVIGLGTGQFGTIGWGYGMTYSDSTIQDVVHKAIDSGVNLFDTAETYGNGMSETLLGRALSGYDRDDYIIVSKVAPWNLRGGNIAKAVESSLRRLQMDFIDLYLIHYPNPFVPLRETLSRMKVLMREGKIRYLGVSNFGRRLLEEALQFVDPQYLVVDEIEYNIFSRRAEKTTIPCCLENAVGVIAFSPLAGEMLTGRYSPSRLATNRARAFNFYNRKGFLKKAVPLFDVLSQISKEKRASIAQVALSYIIRHESFYAIPAALNTEEISQNALAADILLSDSDVRRIDDASVTVGAATYVFDNYAIRPISWIKGAMSHMAFGIP
jgi:myo-inositol catabolism protein IolS